MEYKVQLYPKRKRKTKYTKTGKIRTKPYKRGVLVKQIDEQFQKLIRYRDVVCFSDDGRCSGPIQAGHLITRAALRTRWDFRNCYGSCRTHNMLHEWRPEIMTNWFIAKHGVFLYNELVQLSRQPWKPSRKELEDLLVKFTQENGEEKQLLNLLEEK